MSWQHKLTSFAGAALAAGLMSGTFLGVASAEEVVLKMAVPDWPPTRIMKKMFDEQYKPASGNTVKLEVDFIPWPDFYTRVNASLTSGEQKYNMAVSDSQWLGAFVEGGYYRKINDLIDADPELKAAMDGMHPSILAAYSTYPHKTPNYYGFPQFPDVLVNFVRKDIVCNEEEQKNFQAKFNKKLPCTPEELDDMDWDMFENVGQFFMRKKGENLAGKPADDDADKTKRHAAHDDEPRSRFDHARKRAAEDGWHQRSKGCAVTQRHRRPQSKTEITNRQAEHCASDSP